MGYETMRREIFASVSRHNSERDREHDELWEDACRRIQEVIQDPKYIPIGLWW